jgi:ABC-type transport system involved in multi-copper enzyme maturation permease subunit
MKRIFGIISIVVGLVFMAVAALFLLMAFIQPGNAMAVPIGISAIGGVISSVCIMLGIRLIKSSGSQTNSIPPDAHGSFLPNVEEERTTENEIFTVHYQPPVKKGKHSKPSCLTIKIPSICFTSMQFTRENWADRLGKRLGIACEVQTGDQEFDDTVYTRETNPAYCANFLSDIEVRGAILAVMLSGYQKIQIQEDSVIATWSGFDPIKNGSESIAELTARALLILRSNLAIPDLEITQASQPTVISWKVALWSIAILWATTGISIFFYKPVYPSELFRLALATFFLTYPGFAVIAAMLLKGKSNSHDSWYELILIGFVLFISGSFGTMAGANAMLDKNIPTKRILQVVGTKTTVSGKNKTKRHYAQVNSFKYPGELLEFEVESSLFPQIVPHRSKVHLVSGKGYFDMEWQISADFEP